MHAFLIYYHITRYGTISMKSFQQSPQIRLEPFLISNCIFIAIFSKIKIELYYLPLSFLPLEPLISPPYSSFILKLIFFFFKYIYSAESLSDCIYEYEHLAMNNQIEGSFQERLISPTLLVMVTDLFYQLEYI